MSGIDIFEIILIVAVVGIGIGGFIWAALKDD